jgi:hypothetical protein
METSYGEPLFQVTFGEIVTPAFSTNPRAPTALSRADADRAGAFKPLVDGETSLCFLTDNLQGDIIAALPTMKDDVYKLLIKRLPTAFLVTDLSAVLVWFGVLRQVK